MDEGKYLEVVTDPEFKLLGFGRGELFLIREAMILGNIDLTELLNLLQKRRESKDFEKEGKEDG